MKLISFLRVYNDFEYLDKTLESSLNIPGDLYIIEGSWKSAQRAGANLRSNDRTYDIINKYLRLDKKFKLIQANSDYEWSHCQIAMDLALEQKADWLFLLDADEIHHPKEIAEILQYLTFYKDNLDIKEIRLNSYNFCNSFKKYYDGEYFRIFRVADTPKFIEANHAIYSSNYKYITLPKEIRYYHYNYVKKNNPEAFHLKMKFYDYEHPQNKSLYNQGYKEENGLYTIPVEIKEFNHPHPKIMENHPYFINNIYQDKDITFF
jgi:hypothetical protein